MVVQEQSFSNRLGFCRGENQPASNPGYDCTDMYVTLDGDRWRLIPCNDPTSTGNVLCEYQMLDLEEGWCVFFNKNSK